MSEEIVSIVARLFRVRHGKTFEIKDMIFGWWGDYPFSLVSSAVNIPAFMRLRTINGTCAAV